MKGERAGTREVLANYWAHTKRYPIIIVGLIVAGALIQAATIIAPLYLKDFVDIIAVESSATAYRGLLVALSLFAVFTMTAWAIRRVQFYLMASLETKVMADLTISSFSYVIRHSHHFFISNFVGSLVRRVTRYAKSYETIMDAVLFQLYPLSLLALGIVGMLYMRHPLLGLGLALWLVVFISIQLLLIHRVHPQRLRASEEDSKVTGALSDALSNHMTTSLFSGIAHEKARLTVSVNAWRSTAIRAWRSDDTIWAVQGFMIAVVNIALLFAALQLWRKGLLSVGDFILLQTYLLTLFDRLVQAGREMRHVYEGVAEATEMAEILHVPHEVQDAGGALPLHVTNGEMRFNKVTFSYGGDDILKQFDMHIRPKEKVALVGPSGAGKSTITKLLLRLYDTTGGTIEIDGQNIAKTTLESLRDKISYVPQDPMLFHRSLKENIRYGKREATDEEVIEAAKRAHCHEFIERLPNGYETLVGERGVKLSGGERQRIAIARAILKNVPILILDEATSSLDSESESLIQSALAELMEGKTVIVIAHRLSTIMRMDRIIVIEDGRISAEGTHEELIARDGRYRTLWDIQAGGFLVEEKGAE